MLLSVSEHEGDARCRRTWRLRYGGRRHRRPRDSGLAVARELRARGHAVRFIGTRRGMEARLVPAEDFPIEWIEIGGLKRVGLAQTIATLGACRGACRKPRACCDRAAARGGVFHRRICGGAGAAGGAVDPAFPWW